MRPELLTIAETCEALRITPPTLYRLFSNGSIPKTKIFNKTLVHAKDIDNFIEASKITKAA